MKILTRPCIEKTYVLDGSYSLSNIKHSFEYTLISTEKKTDNTSTRMFVNKTKNIITFKIEIGYYLELLTPQTMKLLGSSEKKR